jgi:hypothetical protein
MIRLAAGAHAIAAVALLAFWYLYALVLPFDQLPQGIQPLAKHKAWTAISLTGGLGALVALVGLVSLWRVEASLQSTLGNVGVFCACLGLAMLGANLFWEALLWPPLAQHAPELLAFDGPIYQNRTLIAFFATAGLLFSAGYICVGAALRPTELPSPLLWCFMIGAPLFAFGPLFGKLQVWVRSAGITTLAVGMLWLAWELWRRPGS